MRLSDFDYYLPEELIAQHPLHQRDASRMLIVDRAAGFFRDDRFANLDGVLGAGDVLVLNDTKVFPARLFGETETGAHVEIFLIRQIGNGGAWEALSKPLRRLRPSRRIVFGGRIEGRILERSAEGRVTIEFDEKENVQGLLESIGRTPLPPYIKRKSRAGEDEDRERYQTVYARSSGAIAAPTAGLHFTKAVLEKLCGLGIEIVEITLHVGYGTFEPVRAEDLSHHTVLPEALDVSEAAAAALNQAAMNGRRVIAVGTTTTRALESNVACHGRFAPGQAMAELTITPGYEFRAINGLLTNFHLPKSSLLVLVSTFGGHELIMEAYRHAVRSGYRFFSYGDCMFVS